MLREKLDENPLWDTKYRLPGPELEQLLKLLPTILEAVLSSPLSLENFIMAQYLCAKALASGGDTSISKMANLLSEYKRAADELSRTGQAEKYCLQQPGGMTAEDYSAMVHGFESIGTLVERRPGAFIAPILYQLRPRTN